LSYEQVKQIQIREIQYNCTKYLKKSDYVLQFFLNFFLLEYKIQFSKLMYVIFKLPQINGNLKKLIF